MPALDNGYRIFAAFTLRKSSAFLYAHRVDSSPKSGAMAYQDEVHLSSQSLMA
jgi:hypothetical protein